MIVVPVAYSLLACQVHHTAEEAAELAEREAAGKQEPAVAAEPKPAELS